MTTSQKTSGPSETELTTQPVVMPESEILEEIGRIRQPPRVATVLTAQIVKAGPRRPRIGKKE